jgi:catechol 2,3-dioxygenase-like lactoylglutathione lyase family enzyme
VSEPRFNGVHFWVRDMAAAVAFYRAIGLPVPDPQGVFVSFDLADGTNFAFGTHEFTRGYDPNFDANRGPSPNSLQFDLESREAVDAMHAKLTGLGYRSNMAPWDAFWGARYTEVCDPDGNVVGFHSPQDAGRKAPPPPGA